MPCGSFACPQQSTCHQHGLPAVSESSEITWLVQPRREDVRASVSDSRHNASSTGHGGRRATEVDLEREPVGLGLPAGVSGPL